MLERSLSSSFLWDYQIPLSKYRTRTVIVTSAFWVLPCCTLPIIILGFFSSSKSFSSFFFSPISHWLVFLFLLSEILIPVAKTRTLFCEKHLYSCSAFYTMYLTTTVDQWKSTALCEPESKQPFLLSVEFLTILCISNLLNYNALFSFPLLLVAVCGFIL